MTPFRIAMVFVILIGGAISLVTLLLFLGPIQISNIGLWFAPQNADLYVNRGVAYAHTGKYAAAVADYNKALELDPKNFKADNELGWLMATCLDDKFRDGKKAVKYATAACDLTSNEDFAYLDTLAAAYAETGDFTAAMQWENKAIDEGGQAWAVSVDAETRLKLYRAGQPYHGKL